MGVAKRKKAQIAPANRRTRRRSISPAVKQHVLLECGYMCGNPRCRAIITLELHHIESVRDGGGNDPTNLLALCGYCHGMHTAGHIPANAIRVWKGMLMSLSSRNRANVDLLLHLNRMASEPSSENVVYSADSLLQLAPLLNSGLAEASLAAAASGGMGGPPYSVFRVKLTPAGENLVTAWLDGDEGVFASALSKTKLPQTEI